MDDIWSDRIFVYCAVSISSLHRSGRFSRNNVPENIIIPISDICGKRVSPGKKRCTVNEGTVNGS